VIYHIATEADWASRRATYAPAGWREDGFVHCCTADQVVRVANRYFRGRPDLLLLEIDPARLSALVVWEDTAGTGEDYPHVYGAVEIDAVTTASRFPPGRKGTFDSWVPPQ
jgi:uncharacterized protein (DUF952 family)